MRDITREAVSYFLVGFQLPCHTRSRLVQHWREYQMISRPKAVLQARLNAAERLMQAWLGREPLPERVAPVLPA